MEIESEPIKTARVKAPIPYSPILRAWVDENKETIRTKTIGLINHNGTEPSPPGFPERTASDPPPATPNPGSVKNLLGLINASNEYGALTRNGTNTSADLFFKRSNQRSLS